MVEGAFEPGGFAPLPHSHRDQDECFYVLEGEFDFRVGGETVRGTPGVFVLVPRGIRHSFVNAGQSTARLLFVHSPALEAFFIELAKLSEAGPSDRTKVRNLMDRWGMDVDEVEPGPRRDPALPHGAPS